ALELGQPEVRRAGKQGAAKVGVVVEDRPRELCGPAEAGNGRHRIDSGGAEIRLTADLGTSEARLTVESHTSGLDRTGDSRLLEGGRPGKRGLERPVCDARPAIGKTRDVQPQSGTDSQSAEISLPAEARPTQRKVGLDVGVTEPKIAVEPSGHDRAVAGARVEKCPFHDVGAIEAHLLLAVDSVGIEEAVHVEIAQIGERWIKSARRRARESCATQV